MKVDLDLLPLLPLLCLLPVLVLLAVLVVVGAWEWTRRAEDVLWRLLEAWLKGGRK